MNGPAGRTASRIEVLRGPAEVVVKPIGVVDLATAPVVRAVLVSLLDTGERVAVCLAGVTLLDAHSARMLRYAYDRAGSDRFRVCEAAGPVASVLEITGTAKLLGLDDETPADGTGDDWTVEALLRARAGLGADDETTRTALRDLAVQHSHGLAVSLARRYRGRNEPFEDLSQVALLGLLKAIEGYDPGYANGFFAYAVPTITGELKRYFRDSGWQIRVPRRLQEIGMALPAAGESLAHTLGRWPTVPELAARVGVTEDELLCAADASLAYRAASLSAPLAQMSSGENTLGETIGGTDPGYDAVDNRESLRRLLPTLPERQRRILAMRFYANMTQAQIASTVGVSQMHVSRLLASALTRLRAGLTRD